MEPVRQLGTGGYGNNVHEASPQARSQARSLNRASCQAERPSCRQGVVVKHGLICHARQKDGEKREGRGDERVLQSLCTSRVAIWKGKDKLSNHRKCTNDPLGLRVGIVAYSRHSRGPLDLS